MSDTGARSLLDEWARRTPWRTDPALNAAALEWAKRTPLDGDDLSVHPHAPRDGEDPDCCRDRVMDRGEWAVHRASVPHLALLFGVTPDQRPDVFISALGHRYGGVAGLIQDEHPDEDGWAWAKALVPRGVTMPDTRLFLTAGLTLPECISLLDSGPTEDRLARVLVLAALRTDISA